MLILMALADLGFYCTTGFGTTFICKWNFDAST